MPVKQNPDPLIRELPPVTPGAEARTLPVTIVNDRIDFNTIKELWDVLDCAYDDPDRQGMAERELAMLKQGTREFLAYFADFQRIMAELKWDPSAKKAALRQGMAGNLKDLLLSYDCPDH